MMQPPVPLMIVCTDGCWFFVKLSFLGISNGSHLQCQPVNCDTSALFLSSLTSRMFLLTDALLIITELLSCHGSQY